MNPVDGGHQPPLCSGHNTLVPVTLPCTTFKAATCLYWPKNAELLATADKVYCTVAFAARDDLQSGEEHVNLNVAAFSKSPHLLLAAILLLLHKSGCVHVTDNLHAVSLSNSCDSTCE